MGIYSIWLPLSGYDGSENPRRGTMLPGPGISFDEQETGPEQARLEREVSLEYDPFQRPRAFPIPKDDDDASS